MTPSRQRIRSGRGKDGGKDLRTLPIEHRKAKLEELLKKHSGAIRYSISFTKDIE